MDIKEPTFDFRLIKTELEELLTTIENKVERDWVEKYRNLDGGRETILPLIRIARNTFKTILFICSDAVDNSSRELYFSLAVSPLTRTLLEALFSLIYLLEDFPSKIDLFDKSYYRDQREITDSLREKYSGIPKWDSYFAEKDAKLEQYENYLLNNRILSEAEKENVENIRYFPRVSKIIKRLEIENSSSVSFLKYLDDFHYRELCGQSHLEPSAIVELYPFFLQINEETIEDEIYYHKSKQIYLATTFILSLISEIEIDFNYGLKSRLSYLWVLLNSGNDLSEEVYKMRYQSLLNPN
jgi:hypothetical protein